MFDLRRESVECHETVLLQAGLVELDNVCHHSLFIFDNDEELPAKDQDHKEQADRKRGDVA